MYERIRFIIIFLISIMVGCTTLSDEEKIKFREAIEKGDRGYVEYILSKGVDLNDEKEFGYVPLHIAVQENNMELVKLFLEKGADINAVDGWKQNCLFKTYNIEMVKYLIEHGANVNQIDIHGVIPLLNVTWYYDLAKLYIEKGANIYHEDEEGDSILFYALMNDNYDLVEYLIKVKKINIRNKNNKGYNPIIWYCAAGGGNIKIANLIIRAGVDVNDSNEDGVNAIIASILNTRCNRKVFKKRTYDILKNISFLKYIVKQGIDINHKDNYGNTSLHYAIKLSREKEIIKLLLDYGADVNIKNKHGETPLDIALEKGDKDIVNLLKVYTTKKGRNKNY